MPSLVQHRHTSGQAPQQRRQLVGGGSSGGGEGVAGGGGGGGAWGDPQRRFEALRLAQQPAVEERMRR